MAQASSPAGEVTPAREDRERLDRPRLLVLLVVLGAAVVGAVLVAVGIGGVAIPVSVSARVVGHHLVPGLVDPARDSVQDQIIWSFRLPRELLAVLVGSGLALVGVVLQAVTRNQLADPYLLGVSSGASLGAVIVVFVAAGSVGGAPTSAGAFAGGVLATLLVYAIAQRRGRITPSRLILAGVAVGYLFDAAFSYLILREPNYANAKNILFWLLGSLASATWSKLIVPAVALAVCGTFMAVRARALNALLAGEETAASLGVDVPRFRLELVAVTALLTGVMVAIAGAIGFVGLIVPHAVRLVAGTDHRRVLPVAALTGALLLVLADLAARTLSPDQELPLSIVTAMVGVPVFLWLLRRHYRGVEEAFG